MARPPAEQTYDVTCPHCHKSFTGSMIGAAHLRGFKCPHCKLFVPYERADEQELVEPAPTPD